MQGANELTLNQATMVEALQMWIDAQMREGKAPKVTEVKQSVGASYQAGIFTVSLNNQDPA